MKKKPSDLRTIHGASSLTGVPRSTILSWCRGDTPLLKTYRLAVTEDKSLVSLRAVERLRMKSPKRGRPPKPKE